MVPIKRDVKKASMAALTTAADLLAKGQLVGIYPEGTRSRDGLLHRGHSGVAHLAMISGAPIIPVGLIGTERVQPIGASVPRPFTGPVTIRFGEPIDPADYRHGGSRKRRQLMLDDVMAAIAAMTTQAAVGRLLLAPSSPHPGWERECLPRHDPWRGRPQLAACRGTGGR